MQPNPSPPRPSRNGHTVKDPIKEFFAITTNDVPDGVPPGEAVMSVALPDGRIIPLITTKRNQALASWENLMASTDENFIGKHYRLIRIHGRREVMLERTL